MKILLLLSYAIAVTMMGVATLTVVASNADGLINEVLAMIQIVKIFQITLSKYTSPGLINSTIILLASLSSRVNLMYIIQINHI